LFRQLNFLKYAAVRLREAINPDQVDAALLDRAEGFLNESGVILNQIIRSNLGLVVFVVKKYTGPGQDYFDLVSDGNMALLRATERFDFARGIRFSTYATWAIARECTRRVRKERTRHARFVNGSPESFQLIADHRGGFTELPRHERSREAIRLLLGRLDDREQRIIARRFGLADTRRTLAELGRELGISKERVRQLESRALDKLRVVAETRESDLADRYG
jgi:RNA polymerase primary sigma factor